MPEIREGALRRRRMERLGRGFPVSNRCFLNGYRAFLGRAENGWRMVREEIQPPCLPTELRGRRLPNKTQPYEMLRAYFGNRDGLPRPL